MSQPHPADNDMARVANIVRELLDSFPHPDTGRGLPGLLVQAWGSETMPATHTTLLHSREAENGEKGGYRKPGSRPPSGKLLTLMANVQTTLDVAHQLAADELGFYINSGERDVALRRIPALLEPTLAGDCWDCNKCHHGVKEICACRHRTITRRLSKCWSSLGAELGYWEHPVEKPLIVCPDCKRAGQIAIRKDQERMYCRYDDCEWHREGVFAILAEAS